MNVPPASGAYINDAPYCLPGRDLPEFGRRIMSEEFKAESLVKMFQISSESFTFRPCSLAPVPGCQPVSKLGHSLNHIKSLNAWHDVFDTMLDDST